MGWLNLGSLVLGIAAWILPVINLLRHNQSGHKSWFVLSLASISTCAAALCLQLYYSRYLVKIRDWSALMDTTDAVVFVSSALLAVTLALNAVTLWMYRGKNRR